MRYKGVMQTALFKVFPQGYDPFLADCNSLEDLGEDYKQYTMNDILKAKELQKQFEIITAHKNDDRWVLPVGRWCQQVK